jgi:hypothetical protein
VRKKQVVDMTQWTRLSDACMGRGIAPPKLNTRTRQRGKTAAVSLIMKKRSSNEIKEARGQEQVSMKLAKQEESHEDMQIESQIELQIAAQVAAKTSSIADKATPM